MKKLSFLFIGLSAIVLSGCGNGEKLEKPFWKGTELMQVCKVPYYSSSACYKLNVRLVDKHTVQILFKNGGYIYASNMTCHKAATQDAKQPKYVFCRSYENNNQQWDLSPVWSYF